MKHLTVNTGYSSGGLVSTITITLRYGIMVVHMVIVYFRSLELSRGTRPVSARLGWDVTLERCTTESAGT